MINFEINQLPPTLPSTSPYFVMVTVLFAFLPSTFFTFFKKTDENMDGKIHLGAFIILF